jgi:hypothetical protein
MTEKSLLEEIEAFEEIAKEMGWKTTESILYFVRNVGVDNINKITNDLDILQPDEEQTYNNEYLLGKFDACKKFRKIIKILGKVEG